MIVRLKALALVVVTVTGFAAGPAWAAEGEGEPLAARMDRLEAGLEYAEDLRAIKRLQRTYGYYLDKGMWTDLAEYFTEDAVANYPAGVYVGKESIREHLYRNVGAVEVGEVGLGDNRLYNHMNIQPVVHVDPGGQTAKGRWRALAFFGSLGGGAIWAEGVYEIGYAKEDGVWKIQSLNYHSGFGAPYETGWVAPEPRPEGEAASRRPRNLPHPADRVRDEDCPGFPQACIAPFHYDNPGISDDGFAWQVTAADIEAAAGKADAGRAAELAHRAMLLKAETDVENLQRIYGYYYDRAMWDQMADLFVEDGTIEFAQRGVYKGQDRVRQFLHSLGPDGLRDGWLNEHMQFQTVVTVAADGKSARARSRELSMTGEVGGTGYWESGIYENRFIKEDGVWKFQSVHYYPTMITPYDKGWGKEALPAPGVSSDLPPDAGPTEVYEIFPKAHIPAYHYRNPVTNKVSTYPDGRPGRPSKAAMKANLMPDGKARPQKVKDVEAAVKAAEADLQRYKDFNEIENLESAYGFYLDKNLWNDLADLFAEEGSIELAQRGYYKGQDRVREFLLTVFGRGSEGPVEGRLGNHIQAQTVIHFLGDERAAVRQRMLQQMSFGTRASHGGAVYQNEMVKEDGRWKISKIHAFNTFSAPYDGGWTAVSGKAMVPGPSEELPPDGPVSVRFDMFPSVYHIPFHYGNPVSGRSYVPVVAAGETVDVTNVEEVPGIPPRIAERLREIGPVISMETGPLYEPLHPKEPYEGVTLDRDVAYGPHERHVMDIYSSPEGGSGKPVVVFIHGGGYSRGAKSAPDSPFYDNIGLWAEREGMVGITINYRLSPEFQFPSGVEDLERLTAWLKENVSRYGGDPDKIVFWGHSAGAGHAADYITAMDRQGKDSGLAGAILTSGIYGLDDKMTIWNSYYGEDPAVPHLSSIEGLVETEVPLFVTDAELDGENFRKDAEALVEAARSAGKPLTYYRLKGHSHLSEAYAIGTSDETLSRPVKRFIESVTED